ncbi:hypothetical protein [Peribacillus asahii]|uniref:Uncharacterized protein n=1 Tax=Peribacillus asahii TaxID=228899 RepID=A0A3T0KXG4_9BACI|nr:hypothetical protein [Peribacillus asahii]AZV45047.1 hypothetical protein BAOM_4467 [Peribacillus asahii]USK84664.1 hypothetical protein LIT35_20090 [Peribacillus asahii]
MKILGISILTMGVLMGFSLGIDLLLGFEIRTSLKSAFNPFRVMEVPEFIVIFLLVFSLVIESVRSFYQKRNVKTNNSEKQP